ncbi:MAG: glycosyltransferase [Pirellulales bacterium]
MLISAYNNAPVLRRCLWALSAQSDCDFRVIVADDGSNETVRDLLNERSFRDLTIDHVRHADRGFRRAAIMNRAIDQADVDYIVMTDADCVPRDDFIAAHRAAAKPGRFVSGGVVNMPIPVHQSFTEDDIRTNRVFDVDFLKSLDTRLADMSRRLARPGRWTGLLNLLTHRHAVMRGNNCAAWRDDLLAVNGFDETFVGYGSEDRDLGARLANLGRTGRMLKFSLVTLHLDHARPYCDPAKQQENRRKFKRRARSGEVRGRSESRKADTNRSKQVTSASTAPANDRFRPNGRSVSLGTWVLGVWRIIRPLRVEFTRVSPCRTNPFGRNVRSSGKISGFARSIVCESLSGCERLVNEKRPRE